MAREGVGLGQDFQPGKHHCGVSRRESGRQLFVANLYRRQLTCGERGCLSKILRRVGMWIEIEQRGFFIINTQNGEIVEYERAHKQQYSAQERWGRPLFGKIWLHR